jgi:hypothetical protein
MSLEPTDWRASAVLAKASLSRGISANRYAAADERAFQI